MLQNIIKNGMDHGQDKIKVQLFEREEKIHLWICNEMTNPEKIDVSRVFQRFYKADGVKQKFQRIGAFYRLVNLFCE